MLEIVSKNGTRFAEGESHPRNTTDNPSINLNDVQRREADLVRQLRRESIAANDSFTKYAFQALGFAGIAYAAIIEFMFFSPFEHGAPPAQFFWPLEHAPAQGQPLLGLAAVPILAFVLLTLRTGTYSYAVSNRQFGYQLYLARVCHVPEKYRGRWKDQYRDIGWEEAMRAWRVVQNTLFLALCKHPVLIKPHRYKPEFKPNPRRPIWFEQESLFGEVSKATWYGDSYLQTMQYLLLGAAWIAVGILCITPFAVGWEEPVGQPAFIAALLGDMRWKTGIISVAAGLALLGAFATIVSVRNESARRDFLRDGLLSIHACAIVWQAAILAHANALERARNCGLTSWQLARLARPYSRRAFRRVTKAQWRSWRDGEIQFEDIAAIELGPEVVRGVPDGAGLTGYTFWIGQEAESLARCASDVLGWIGVGERELKGLAHH